MPSARSLGRARGLAALQIAASVTFQLAFIHVARGWFTPPSSDAVPARLAFALNGILLAGTMLLLLIGYIAGARPTWLETIGGAPDAAQLERHVRVQRNTVEQLIVLAISHLALATTLPRADLSLLPALAAMFVVARAFYSVGYVRDPMYRTFGFVATFYPNIYAFALARWQ